jgi:hypothetical protein
LKVDVREPCRAMVGLGSITSRVGADDGRVNCRRSTMMAATDTMATKAPMITVVELYAALLFPDTPDCNLAVLSRRSRTEAMHANRSVSHDSEQQWLSLVHNSPALKQLPASGPRSMHVGVNCFPNGTHRIPDSGQHGIEPPHDANGIDWHVAICCVVVTASFAGADGTFGGDTGARVTLDGLAA